MRLTSFILFDIAVLLFFSGMSFAASFNPFVASAFFSISFVFVVAASLFAYFAGR